ncbi:MAG: fatty acyl-CoA reductase, partial [bacterium]
MTSGETVLITGATGFLGKVVLEELLRTREHTRVILIVRQRGKLTAEDRLRQLSTSPCFDALPDAWIEQVSAVQGDLTETRCGVSEEDLTRIRSTVTRVIHCAASIEFDLPVADAASANITSTLNVMELARSCAHLRSVVSVSTAYVTPHLPHTRIEETLVPVPWDPATVYRDIQSGAVTTEDLLPQSGHPNSYTLTKCLAEHLLVSRFSDLPLSIVRPSIISASRAWPVAGWLDSRAAFAAFVALIGSGHLRALIADLDTHMDIVPCDVVAHDILTELFSDERATAERSVPIRHSTVGLDQAITIREARDEILRFFGEYPVEEPPSLRYIGPPGRAFRIADYREHHRRLGSREMPMSERRAAFIRQQTDYLNTAFRYFTLNSFDFRRSLPWPGEKLNTAAYIHTICAGVYRYLMRRSRHELLIGGNRLGRLQEHLGGKMPSVFSPDRSRRVLRLAGTVLSELIERVTVDEMSLRAVRDRAPAGSLILFEAEEREQTVLVSLITAYALLMRRALGF